MATIKTVVTPTDFNTSQFDVTTGGKVNLLAAFMNPFFKQAALDSVTTPDAPAYVFTRHDNTEVRLPAGVNDIHVTTAGTSYDAATSILTLGFTNGGIPVTINLAELSKTATQDSTSVAFTGEGTSGNKLSATVIVKAAGGILAGANGLELDPTAVNTLTHDVILADMAGNFLISGGSTPTS